MIFVERVLFPNFEFENVNEVQYYKIAIEGELNMDCSIYHNNRFVDIYMYM